MKTWYVRFTSDESTKFECDYVTRMDGYWEFRLEGGRAVAYVPESQVKYLEELKPMEPDKCP